MEASLEMGVSVSVCVCVCVRWVGGVGGLMAHSSD